MKEVYLFFITFSLIAHCSLGGIAVYSDTSDVNPDSSKGFIMRPNLLVNYYSTSASGKFRPKKQAAASTDDIGYKYKELSIMGYYPLLEKSYIKRPNTLFNPNLAILGTGSISISQADLKQYDLKPFARVSVGIRTIYFDGNKSIWMASFSPFVSESFRSFKNLVPRFFASALYSRAVSEYFSYRIGVTFTYLYDGGTLLPLIGFRVGDYNKLYFNFQLPRDISLNFRMGQKCWGGVFTRLSGGIYRFTTDQTIFDLRNKNTEGIVLSRQELLTGLMFNYYPNNNLYFSFNIGFTSQRKLSLAKTNELIPVKGYSTEFKDQKLNPSLFINLSVSYFFGKPTYSGGYNYLIEEKAINNNIDAGDLNIGNNQINNDMNMVKPKDVSKRDIKKVNASYLDLRDVLLDE